MFVHNMILSVVTIVFSIVFLIYANTLPEGRPGSGTWGPGAWPALMLSLLLVMGTLLLIKTVIRRKKEQTEDQETDHESAHIESTQSEHVETEILEPDVVYPSRYWVIFGLIILYTFLMGYIGFTLSTLLFIFFATKVMGMQKWLSSLMTTVISTGAIIFIFANLLAVPLPRGIGLFRELSFLIY